MKNFLLEENLSSATGIIVAIVEQLISRFNILILDEVRTFQSLSICKLYLLVVYALEVFSRVKDSIAFMSLELFGFLLIQFETSLILKFRLKVVLSAGVAS